MIYSRFVRACSNCNIEPSDLLKELDLPKSLVQDWFDASIKNEVINVGKGMLKSIAERLGTSVSYLNGDDILSSSRINFLESTSKCSNDDFDVLSKHVAEVKGIIEDY